MKNPTTSMQQVRMILTSSLQQTAGGTAKLFFCMFYFWYAAAAAVQAIAVPICIGQVLQPAPLIMTLAATLFIGCTILCLHMLFKNTIGPMRYTTFGLLVAGLLVLALNAAKDMQPETTRVMLLSLLVGLTLELVFVSIAWHRGLVQQLALKLSARRKTILLWTALVLPVPLTIICRLAPPLLK